jgi:hypothetical protein
MTVQPHITSNIGLPRAVYLRYPAGNQVGEPGKPIQQRTILTDALEAVNYIKSPGTVVELPYRWRRFPIQEEPKFLKETQGWRHPKAEAIGETLDVLIRQMNEYKAFLEAGRAELEASDNPKHRAGATRWTWQLDNLDRLHETIDSKAIDEYRAIYQLINALEVWAHGKFV